METKTLSERIKTFNETKNKIQKLSEEGEDFDYSIPMEMMETGSEIITKLQAENQALIETLKQINSSDNSQYNATLAHKVLKKYGKL